jgi:hypothetical protein
MPEPTQFGQAIMQLAEARQQVAELQAQVERLTTDLKNQRDLDRLLFDEQATHIAVLQRLAQDWQQYVKDDDEIDLGKHFEAEYEVAQEQRAKLERRTKELCRKVQ